MNALHNAMVASLCSHEVEEGARSGRKRYACAPPLGPWSARCSSCRNDISAPSGHVGREPQMGRHFEVTHAPGVDMLREALSSRMLLPSKPHRDH